MPIELIIARCVAGLLGAAALVVLVGGTVLMCTRNKEEK